MDPNQNNLPTQNQTPEQAFPIVPQPTTPTNPEPAMENQTSPVTPPSAPSNKNFALIIAAIVLLLVVGVTGVFAYQKYFVKSEAIENTSPTPTASADPTADWKTYAAIGYSFKYPSSWTIKIDNKRVNISPQEQPEIGSYPSIHFNEADNPQKLSLEEFEKSQEGKGTNLYSPDAAEIKIASTTAFRQENGSCEPFVCDLVVIPYLDKFYVISNVYSGNEKVSKLEFDQILSTFKFSEDQLVTDSDGWQIYKNDKYKFEIKVPPTSFIYDNRNTNDHNYIRLQNYTKTSGAPGLPKGEYYLEIFIKPTNDQPNNFNCTENIKDGKTIDVGGVKAVQGIGEGGGDSAPIINSLCIDTQTVDYLIYASEFYDNVTKKIIDSFKFTN